MESESKFHSLPWVKACVFGVIAASSAAEAAPLQQSNPHQLPIQLLPHKVRNQIELELVALLSQEIRSCCDKIDLPLPGGISATLNLQSDLVEIELGAALGPYAEHPDMDFVHSVLTQASIAFLQDKVKVRGVVFLYGGKDLYFYAPDLQPHGSDLSRNTLAPDREKPVVSVAAGHGIYFHHGYGDWRYQRDPSHGVTEDVLTQQFANHLKQYLNYRQIASVVSPRHDWMTTHPGSGERWSNVAARYQLESILPDHPEIWNSLPNSTSPLRDYNEDIRSRPYYANFMDADSAIHLHTNAATPSARGTFAFVHEEKPESIPLASNALCYMKEAIQSIEGYGNYPVNITPIANRKGENGLAKMPSVIVEIGFHTNPDDVEAMKDPLFQAAAMRGLAKGVYLFHQGKDCRTFELEKMPNLELKWAQSFRAPVSYHGYPTFPIDLVYEVVECPSSWESFKCGRTRKLYFSGEVPEVALSCGPQFETTTATYRVWILDFDGVRTEPVEFQLTCLKRWSPADQLKQLENVHGQSRPIAFRRHRSRRESP